MADKPELSFKDNICVGMFTVREMTVLLLACAYTFRKWHQGEFDSEAMHEVPPGTVEAMMDMMGEMRPKLTEMICDAIGPENSAKAMAYVEQKMQERFGGKSH